MTTRPVIARPVIARPVIVGIGQINDRSNTAEPIDLMTRCAQAAFDDAGSPTLRERVTDIRTVWGVWPYHDPAALVAQRLGVGDVRTTKTTVGGNQLYDLLIDSAKRIADGEDHVAVICAAETLRTRRADYAAGNRSDYIQEADGAEPDITFGSQQPLNTDLETTLGFDAPTSYYAMAETALRHRNGETPATHKTRIAELWAKGSRVASHNPRAWLTDVVDAETIATETGSNRPIASPYPKLMTSNLNVDQGGAFIICSTAMAQAAGIPQHKWIYPWAGVGAVDAPSISQRAHFDASPALRIAGQRTLELAGVGVDECRFVDLYSCFPVAVQVAQKEIGVEAERDWTLTGGLTFAAGPLNCYCILPLVRAVELLRENPTDQAFLTGNGGFFSKHSFVVLSSTPNAGFQTDDVQARIDAEPQRDVNESGELENGTLETYTVTYNRDGQPNVALISALDRDGVRTLATTDDPATLTDLVAHDRVGAQVRVTGHHATVG